MNQRYTGKSDSINVNMSNKQSRQVSWSCNVLRENNLKNIQF